jgi:recombination protein RecA
MTISFEDIAKELKKDSTQFTSAREAGKVMGWADTGNYALNWAVSNRFNGGYPMGHVVELFGPEAAGKSLLVARTIAEFQKQFEDGFTLLDDTENAFNPDWAERSLGVDVDRLQLIGSVTVEDHFKAVEAVLQALKKQDPPVPALIALDSLALLTDDHELESEFNVHRVGGRAKEIRKLFRKTRPLLKNMPVLYMLTNHETANIGGWGSTTDTPGGTGPRYQSSVRISLKNPKKIKKGSEVRGVQVRASIVKNRVTSPYREATISIPFYRPISRYSGLIPVLVELGIIEPSGRTISYEEEDTGVYIQKTNPIKQDRSAQELVEKYPDILTKADEMIASQEDETSISEDYEIGDDDE